ncbi:MAG: orotidine-5'-phosphate decarboxylase [Deltaproteobacteria bacterium]|nr:orotidine-5'-phosphate decarboxylase [Deltaproteobacteria bacterium]
MKLNPLIVALDVENAKLAKAWVKRLSPEVVFYKVGLRLFIQEGPSFIKWLKGQGLKVFLDLKLHDIPNTVAQAVESALKLQVDLLSVHALGGEEMMRAAVKAAQKKTQIFAVTVLTSCSEIKSIGVKDSIRQQVQRLTALAAQAKVNGIICSPQEIKWVKEIVEKRQKILTPGIRPEGANLHDQKRVASPRQALKEGANYLVMGRPILEAEDPGELIRGLFG